MNITLDTYGDETTSQKFTKPLRALLGGRIITDRNNGQGDKICSVAQRVFLAIALIFSVVGLFYTLPAAYILLRSSQSQGNTTVNSANTVVERNRTPAGQQPNQEPVKLQNEMVERMISVGSWGRLKTKIQKNPALLSGYISDKTEYPTLLFYLARYGNNSTECREVSQIIFECSNWSVRDGMFGNTPILAAIANGNIDSIRNMLEYITNHPELHYMLSSVNCKLSDDCCNTPLLMAIKNGDQDTACQLIQHYSAGDLMHYENQGLTAMHLACYVKLNRVVEEIIRRSEFLGCKEEILQQKNCLGFSAYELYTSEFEEPTEVIEPSGFLGYRHSKISLYRYAEAIGFKHRFKYEVHSDKVMDENIANALMPSVPDFDESKSLFSDSFFTQNELENIWFYRSVKLSAENTTLIERNEPK